MIDFNESLCNLYVFVIIIKISLCVYVRVILMFFVRKEMF